MNVQTGTCLHAHSSALILWGVIGVSVKRAISWKKTGKHALKEREVRQAFYLCVSLFIPGRQMEFSVLQTSGSRYTLQLLRVPALFWFSGRVRENVTNGSDHDRVGFYPRFSGCSWGGGGRFATSSHEFIFHYHIFRNDWRVENPPYVFVLGNFVLLCGIVGTFTYRWNPCGGTVEAREWTLTINCRTWLFPQHFTLPIRISYWKIPACLNFLSSLQHINLKISPGFPHN